MNGQDYRRDRLAIYHKKKTATELYPEKTISLKTKYFFHCKTALKKGSVPPKKQLTHPDDNATPYKNEIGFHKNRICLKQNTSSFHF